MHHFYHLSHRSLSDKEIRNPIILVQNRVLLRSLKIKRALSELQISGSIISVVGNSTVEL